MSEPKGKDRLVEALEAVLDDDGATATAKIRAVEQLAKLRPPKDASIAADGDPEAAMRAVVERIAPDPPELAKVPADPMRTLDFQTLTGREMDPVAASWLSYLPAATKAEAERVEREVVAAARRLGLGRGPHELPESADELAARRRRRPG